MAEIKEAKNRFIMLLNADGYDGYAKSGDSVYTKENPTGRTGQQENSIFYMGFSKNFNNIINAVEYPISNAIRTPNNTTDSSGTACCVEFEGFDSGFQGPMISQKIRTSNIDINAYDRSWLTTMSGQSQKIGVFPVNIAMHTFVDNDFVASHALAQAWLLKDANKINSGYLDPLSTFNVSGNNNEYGPSGESRDFNGSWRPCVYKHMYNVHIKNDAFGLNPGGYNENRLLYNSISSLRKNAYFRAYGDVLYPGHVWWGSDKYGVDNFQGVNASNCMNYYDTNLECNYYHYIEHTSYKYVVRNTWHWLWPIFNNRWWWPYVNLIWERQEYTWTEKAGRDDNRNLSTTSRCETKSYGGGYVSLHHLHFTTVGDTTSDTLYENMYFYIPRSTGETATEIPLTDGKYDASTNTTHYWVYFYNNRVTNKSVYNDNYVESGWSYDSPINIPVGKVYSKITPVSTVNANELPKEGMSIDESAKYSCTTDRMSIGSSYPYNGEGSDSSPVHYIASFTTSFNIYIACKELINSSPRKSKRNSEILGAGESSTNFRFEEEKDYVQANSFDEEIEIEDEIPIQETQEEELDPDNNLVKSITNPAGVQICSISGVLVDDTWAFSHIRNEFKNLEYARSTSNHIDVYHHSCIGLWGEWLDTPKMHSLLLLQHCCGSDNENKKRDFIASKNQAYDPNSPTYQAELRYRGYYPGIDGDHINQGDSSIHVVSSKEENSFILNNAGMIRITGVNEYASLNDSRWLKYNNDVNDPVIVHNIIKLSNNNAKLNMPTEDGYKLTTPSAHNRSLYTICCENEKSTINTTSELESSLLIESTGIDSSIIRLEEWMKNHVLSNDSSIDNNSIIDLGVKFVKRSDNNDNKYYVRTFQTIKDINGINDSSTILMHKVEDDRSSGYKINERLNTPNLPFVTGKLGSVPEYARKYRAKFSIVKDSVRINGISLNKMASRFPLEARSKDIPNIITFKMGIDFKYYYASNDNKNKPRLDSSGRLQYVVQLPNNDPSYGKWNNCVYNKNGTDGNGIKLLKYGEDGYGNSENIWTYENYFVPKIFNDTDADGKEYGIGNKNPIIPFYKIYTDDLCINSVGTTKEIVLPAKYDKNFPYYNVSLRLPLTAIDEEFCSKIGSNKFIGAPCYDISNPLNTYEYINEEGANVFFKDEENDTVQYGIRNDDAENNYQYELKHPAYIEIEEPLYDYKHDPSTGEILYCKEEEFNETYINKYVYVEVRDPSTDDILYYYYRLATEADINNSSITKYVLDSIDKYVQYTDPCTGDILYRLATENDTDKTKYVLDRVPKYRLATEEERDRSLRDPSSGFYRDPSSGFYIDDDGYILDGSTRIQDTVIRVLQTDPSTGELLYDTSIFDCSLYGIQSENCVLKGIKYDFKILKATIESDSREVLTCLLKFWNDSDTFGFLDFSFKFPKFCFDTNGDEEITGNEMDAYTIEGSTTLSSLLSKIIIKGVEKEDNEILFNSSSFKTTIKKALDSEVQNQMRGSSTEANTQYDPSTGEIFDFITVQETTIREDDDGNVTDASTSENDPDINKSTLSSEIYGVMNIGKITDKNDKEIEVLTDPENFAVLNRTTGEVIGVGNDSPINYTEYGRFINSYLYMDPSTRETFIETAGQGEGLGMKNVENSCLARNILPILSNKITVY